MRRSRASSKSPAVITSRPSRTATMAASLTRLARSAPEKPGVPRATTLRSTSPASFLPRQCTARIAARSADVRQRDGRPAGRTGPAAAGPGRGSPGRFVAASTTMPVVGSKPSISASSWLSVCSRSSLATYAPCPRARRWPIASISSMKMMAGARLRASANRSRTRDAPTPTNSSTKLGPGHGEERHLRLAGHRPGQQRLAGARRPDHQHAAGHDRARPRCSGPAS